MLFAEAVGDAIFIINSFLAKVRVVGTEHSAFYHVKKVCEKAKENVR